MMFRVFRVAKDKLPTAKKIVESEEFKMQGYKLVTAQSLGMAGEVQYLYVEGDDAFFKKIFDKLTYFVAGLDNLPPELAGKISEMSEKEKAQYKEGKFVAIPSKLKELDELKGAEAAEVADKIKKQDERAQEGLGFIFS